jgi:hypothetical protein
MAINHRQFVFCTFLFTLQFPDFPVDVFVDTPELLPRCVDIPAIC